MHYEVHLLHPHSVQIYMFFVLIIFGRKKAPLSPFSLQQTINARRALSIIQNTLNAATEADTVRPSFINYEFHSAFSTIACTISGYMKKLSPRVRRPNFSPAP